MNKFIYVNVYETHNESQYHAIGPVVYYSKAQISRNMLMTIPKYVHSRSILSSYKYNRALSVWITRTRLTEQIKFTNNSLKYGVVVLIPRLHISKQNYIYKI